MTSHVKRTLLNCCICVCFCGKCCLLVAGGLGSFSAHELEIRKREMVVGEKMYVCMWMCCGRTYLKFWLQIHILCTKYAGRDARVSQTAREWTDGEIWVCRCVLFWHGPGTCLSVDWFSWTTNKDTYQMDCKYVIRNMHKWVGV